MNFQRLVLTGICSMGVLSCSKNSFSGTASSEKALTSQGNPAGETASAEPTGAHGTATNAQQTAGNSAAQDSGSGSTTCPPPLTTFPQQPDPSNRVKVGTVSWQGSNERVVQLSAPALSYTTSTEVAEGVQVYGDVLPEITNSGWHLDVKLLKGFSDGFVAWLGVSNTTTDFHWPETSKFAGWYWSGAVWAGGVAWSRSTCAHSPLNAATYRLAMRLEGGQPRLYLRKSGESVRGPYVVPDGALRLMMLPQGGYKFPAAEILNSGDIYQGGGGLF